MLTRKVTILNKRGLHARASAKFVKLAESFEADVTVRKDDTAVSGCSIMGLMMLAAAPGCEIELTAAGPSAESAMAALIELVANKFDED
ncbi:HPr family phosphocarrier protein [Kiloniella laminariae]|uniref:HPr family phosphocarrier protein n=1 Tax=Kiloniella laminariae TaxID=454162 RepID=A0ABT4LK88_9PROT|nr:HPr family phosphocarrier protein [Kiloniella laminariae]MCZ4281370.1 HPr family phosphocarrier protein [Kiloniella laminariae]